MTGSDQKWTKANRQTKVIRHEIHAVKVGNGLGPSLSLLNASMKDSANRYAEGDEVWQVSLTARTGLDRDSYSFTYFNTYELAERAVAEAPVGTVFDDRPMPYWPIKKMLADTDPTKQLALVFGGGDEDDAHGNCYEALVGAGVKSQRGFGTSTVVLDWAGPEYVMLLEEKFGENWSAVLEFDYCQHHFSTTSLAYLAAKLFLNYFVTYDDYAVGYLTKEILAIAGGTEDLVSASVKTRKRAGEAGGRDAQNKKRARLELFMSEIEKLADVVGLLSEERIISQAYDNAKKLRPDMPSTVKIRFDYEVILRDQEPFKSRYEQVFKKGA
ncbi:hypothetical protein N9V68_01680 [Octadecabacter sp.]|nr:hypothetical protein [Octadecabacter sp.]